MQSYKSLLASFYVVTLIHAACVIGTVKFHLRHIYIAASQQVHQLTRPHHTHRSREPSYFTKQLAFFCLALRPDAIGIGKCLWNSSACRYAHNKKDQANHQEQEEQR